MKTGKRRICVVLGSRANYASIKSAMEAIQKHPQLELSVVVGASALLDRYGSMVNVVMMASVVMMLCSEEGRGINGQAIVIDGGGLLA